jgi:hypothetical protein
MMCAMYRAWARTCIKGMVIFIRAIETFLLFLGDGFELDKNPVLNKSGLRMEPDGR